MKPPTKPIPLPAVPGRKAKAVHPDGKVRYRTRPSTGKDGGKGRGRPTKQAGHTMRIICGRLKQGASIEAACRLAGISVSSHNNWMQAGEGGDPEHELYFREVSKALAESEFFLVGKIRKSDRWQAQAWILAKRFPEQWGSNKVKVMAQDGGKALQAGPSGVTIIIEGGHQDPDLLPDDE